MEKHNKTIIIAEKGNQNVKIERIFNAPRKLVFKAFTDPDLYVQWMGPRDLKTKMETFNPVHGGSYRFIQWREGENKQYKFRGVFHEVSPSLIIQTFEFEGMKDHVALETMFLEDLPDGKTKVSGQSVFQSVSDRDEMVKSGMERGVHESHERLDELLDTLKNK